MRRLICRALPSSRRATPATATLARTQRWCWPRLPGKTRARWPKPSPLACAPTRMSLKPSVAGPGFVNLRLHNGYWQNYLARLLELGADFGRSKMGAGSKVNVEYVSANPTGPMHVGHCRGAVVGDTPANLLAFTGHDVTKEYLDQRRRRADRRLGALACCCATARRSARRSARSPQAFIPATILCRHASSLPPNYGD